VNLAARTLVYDVTEPVVGRVVSSAGGSVSIDSGAVIERCDDLAYLSGGDIVAVHPSGLVRVLYRHQSRHNFLFVTDQCNSYCLMCSQPPKVVDDSYRLLELHRVIDLIDVPPASLGITGGEPTIFGAGFLALIDHCRRALPATALHVLTNGRRFADRRFARELGGVAHPNLTLAIPVYSDVPREHDYVVQVAGAFAETVDGLLNLAEEGGEVEIRIVVHRQTYARLRRTAEFICSNLPFAMHVAIMGLEITGFTIANLDELWIDPLDYQQELRDAVRTLACAGIDVSIYNHPLCLLPRDLWSFARQSISDWKNVYVPECESCEVRTSCGGFFQSSTIRRSRGVHPLREG
jgi:His-Xaa-Ser system radical SAM maturase HxsC